MFRRKNPDEEKKIRQQLFNEFAEKLYPDKTIEELTHKETTHILLYVEDRYMKWGRGSRWLRGFWR